MESEKVIVLGMVIVAIVMISKVIVPVAQAFARRLDGSAAGGRQSPDIADLEARVRDLEGREARMAELEERLDFTERLLAQQRDPSRFGAGEPR